MTRYVKLVTLLVLAVAAFAGDAGEARALSEFHCSVEACRFTVHPDGTGKSAHHVLVIENSTKTESVSVTCEELEGFGEGLSSSKSMTEVLLQFLNYRNCTVNGSPGAGIVMNGCKYKLSSTATELFSIVGCKEGKDIEIGYNTCTLTIGETETLSGIKFTTIGTSPTREITSSISVSGIAVTADGTRASCLIDPKAALTATYTTGNMILTGETGAGTMADAWFV